MKSTAGIYCRDIESRHPLLCPRGEVQKLTPYPTLQSYQLQCSEFPESTYQNATASPATSPIWFMTTYLPRCLAGATSLDRLVCYGTENLDHTFDTMELMLKQLQGPNHK
jgi:hypothetical protein